MKNKDILHFRLAERGKMHSLDKNYKEALRHYREAMRLIQNQKDSELFFQHYSQCVMEALEQSGAYDEVISFCEKYRDFLEEKEVNELTKKHKAFVCERQAIQHLFKEENIEAKELLLEAQKTIGKTKQPVTDELLNWLQRGYLITKKQIEKVQQKHQYFIVRKELINPKIAMDLPESISVF